MPDDTIPYKGSPLSTELLDPTITPEEAKQDLANAIRAYVGCSPQLAKAMANAFVLSQQELSKWLDEAEIEASEDTQ